MPVSWQQFYANEPDSGSSTWYEWHRKASFYEALMGAGIVPSKLEKITKGNKTHTIRVPDFTFSTVAIPPVVEFKANPRSKRPGYEERFATRKAERPNR
jgi:hypothetical protein